jgi:uncharacterized protein (UPF0248 family)
MNDNYDDIINLPHPISKNHPQMSMLNRAAQFAPFAALTGHDAAIQESARLTDSQIDLDESANNILSEKLNCILAKIEEKPTVELTHFQPDVIKSGGSYVVTTGTIKKFDEYDHCLVMDNGQRIPISSILKIRSSAIDDSIIYD